jgi:hypothetical protein
MNSEIADQELQTEYVFVDTEMFVRARFDWNGKALSSVITSKPAINDHFKTGQRSRVQNMMLFYRDGAGSRKFCAAST